MSEVSGIFSNRDICFLFLELQPRATTRACSVGESVKHLLSKDCSNKHAKLGKNWEKMKLQPMRGGKYGMV